jgi:hypothetical protein
MRRHCPGYRNEQDLLFRDETAHTAIKAQKKAGAGEAIPSRSDESAVSPAQTDADLHNGLSDSEMCLSQSLSFPIHEIGVNYLLGAYLHGSHFEYFPDLYRDKPSILLSSVAEAVGLASLSQQSSRPELLDQARVLYARALNDTNLALQSSDSACNDEVLASVMLLALFESISQENDRNTHFWSHHINGAMALVTLRGKKQLKSKIGLQMFRQIARCVLVLCVQQRQRVPIELRELTRVIKQQGDGEAILLEFSDFMEAYTDFRASVRAGEMVDGNGVLQESERLDQWLQDLSNRLPWDYAYDTIPCNGDDASIHGNKYFKHQNPHSAQLWNNIWMARLALNAVIYDLAAKLLETHLQRPFDSPDPCPLMNRAQINVTTMARNICASVRQYIPFHTQRSSPGPQQHIASGYFLIWPLFSTGANPLVTRPIRAYVIECLEWLSTVMKIPQALNAAELLNREQEKAFQLEDW